MISTNVMSMENIMIANVHISARLEQMVFPGNIHTLVELIYWAHLHICRDFLLDFKLSSAILKVSDRMHLMPVIDFNHTDSG